MFWYSLVGRGRSQNHPGNVTASNLGNPAEHKRVNGLVAVIDDDLSVRRALSRLLRFAGFEVCTFDSGEAFLRSGITETLCCVVMDVHLGGLTGPEVKAQMSQLGSEIPVIFITADEDVAQRLQPCLKKPFPASELIAMIWQQMALNV